MLFPNPFGILQDTSQLNWASWIRTNVCSSQSAVPYRLAIAHQFYKRCSNHRIKVDTGIRTLGLQSHNLAR